MKTVKNEALQLIRDLLVNDSYPRASSRAGDMGTQNHPGREVLLEKMVHLLFPEVFPNDPADPLTADELRVNRQALEMHLESGSGASYLQLPGWAKAVIGSDRITFDVPDERTTGVFIDLLTWGGVYTYVSDINLKPADSIGSISMEWNAPTKSLMLTIGFETSGTEIRGDVTANFDEITAQIFLRPRLSKGRILWDWGVRSRVSVTDDNITRSKILASDDEFADDIKNAFTTFIIAGGGSLFRDVYLWFANDDDAAEGLAKGLAGVFASYVSSLSELIGNVLLALPLRPVSAPVLPDIDDALFQALVQELQSRGGTLGLVANSLSQRGQLPNPLDARPAFVFQLLFGNLNEEFQEVALGEQNLVNIFPFHDTQQTISRFVTIFDRLQAEWLQAAPHSSLSELEAILEHILADVTPREFETYLNDRLELSHIVNRTERYTQGEVVNEDGEAQLKTDSEEFNNALAQKPEGVNCMRYLLSLDRIILDENLRGYLEAAFPPPADVQADAQGDQQRVQPRTYIMSIEWEVYSFHEAFEDPLGSDNWQEDNEGLLPGCRLLKKQKKNLSLKGYDNGLGNDFRRELYLEWSTADEMDAPNCKLLIRGRLWLGGSDLGPFRIIVPMHRNVGLYTSASGVLANGEVDNITSFKAEGMAGKEDKQFHAYTIYASLLQRPFSKAYEWVNTSLLNFVMHRPEDMEGRKPLIQPHHPFFLEARINGLTFQTSRVFYASNKRNLDTLFRGTTQTLGSEWSKDIIFSRDDIGAEFELEVIAHILDPVTYEEGATLSASKTVHRFSDAQEAAIAASGSSLQSAIQEAVDSGAANEWGIPVGLPFAEFVLTSENHEFSVTVRISNKNLDRATTPAIRKPKDIRVDFVKADVGENGDFSNAEIKFSPKVLITEGTFKATYELGSTRQFSVSDNEEVIFPGTPSKVVTGHPNNASILASCFGKEYDNPRWFDPHDSLGTARIDEDIPGTDGIDGEHVDNSNGPDGDFDLTVKFTTTSPPPAPRLRFQGLPDSIDFRVSAANAPLSPEFETGWANELRLTHKDENTGGRFVLSPQNIQPQQGTLTGMININPSVTTEYRMEAINAATQANGSPSRSAVLKVEIQQ